MLTNGIRFFATALLSAFAFAAESCRRILFAWANVDRLACWLAVGMLIGACLIGSSFCSWMALGAVTCLSVAAWRGERWNLKKDAATASDRFRQGWEQAGQTTEPLSKVTSSRTTFSGAMDTPRHEL